VARPRPPRRGPRHPHSHPRHSASARPADGRRGSLRRCHQRLERRRRRLRPRARTKPTTLGSALTDSPAGLAAWIAEKIVAWSSNRPDGSPAFDRELLLSTLTLYWATGTIATSLLPYWAYAHNPDAALPADDPSPVPTAVSIFGGERIPFPKPPRELAQRYYTLTSWAEHPVGGHFPAAAEPQLLAQTLRDAFRDARHPPIT
jgi:hypothetical protein